MHNDTRHEKRDRCTVILTKLSLFMLVLGVTGCSVVATEPLTHDEINQKSLSARVLASENVDPIVGELSIEEAVARAIKYNLAWRTRLMEEALSRNQLDVSRYDMLPTLAASAGYNYRSEHNLTTAVDSVTGNPSLSNPFISNEKSHGSAGLGLSWNTLDFGVSYYNAKQNADRVLSAMERRRKALHALTQDVNSAYWRAASAQSLRPQITEAITVAEAALDKSRQEQNEQLRGAEESLRYQRQLLENLRLLEVINQELSSATEELAFLINAPAGAPLSLAAVEFKLPEDLSSKSIGQLEQVAIGNNAELREKIYDKRIATLEAKKAIHKLLPRLNLSVDYKYDDDSYLVNNDWAQAGSLISFNLFNLLKWDSVNKLNESAIDLKDQKITATLMAVIAKLHIARLDYIGAVKQFGRADEVWQVDEQLQKHTHNRVSTQTQGEMDLVAQRTIAIISLLRRYQAYADVQAAAGRLQSSLGLEPEIGSIHEFELGPLTEVVRGSLNNWQYGIEAASEVSQKPALFKE